MPKLKTIFISVSMSLIALNSQAAPIPNLNLSELCNKSDLIVVGQITSVSELSKSDMVVRGRSIRVNHLQAHMEAEKAIKGEINTAQLLIDFIQPEEYVGYRVLNPQTYQVVFLKHGSLNWEFTSSYYPSFRAVPGIIFDSEVVRNHKGDVEKDQAARKEDDVPTKVTKVLAGALDSPLVSDDDRYELMEVLGQVKNTESSRALLQASKNSNLAVQVCAIGELLRRDEVSVLPLAVSLLSNKGTPRRFSPGCALDNLAGGVAIGVTHPWAIPYLGQLLQLDDVVSRQAAASALGRIGKRTQNPQVKKSVAQLLASALQDADFEVRYSSVTGLSDLSGGRGWRPLREDFKQNEDKYLNHWKAWSAEKGR